MLELQLLPFKTITTPRLVLREITINDAPEVFAFRSNKEAMLFIGKPPAKSIDEAKELIQKFNDGLNNNDAATWGITLAGEDKIIGTIGFWRMEKDHYRAEIGYMLHPDYWNKGIASEALNAVMEHGFKDLKFHTIQAFLTPENISSSRLLEKAGFVKEAHFKDNYFFEGVFSDTAVYSKINPDH
ncbi:MAG: acetyltransferase, ribosomal protein N-acetylase [Bacteroidetes bacterium]|jgi:ribosomal-protein-alanine N-acetyltransferase|nr:acetyltransferase, ribosomal protein N-acetylase [Bacteroidota bacterium]